MALLRLCLCLRLRMYLLLYLCLRLRLRDWPLAKQSRSCRIFSASSDSGILQNRDSVEHQICAPRGVPAQSATGHRERLAMVATVRTALLPMFSAVGTFAYRTAVESGRYNYFTRAVLAFAPTNASI